MIITQTHKGKMTAFIEHSPLKQKLDIHSLPLEQTSPDTLFPSQTIS
jgi:hypothetical protein